MIYLIIVYLKMFSSVISYRNNATWERSFEKINILNDLISVNPGTRTSASEEVEKGVEN